MVEEVENGFDPWTLRFVVEELIASSERGTQVFLTTHSPFLMNMLPRQVFQFVTRVDGGSRFSRLDGEDGARRALEVMRVGDAYAGNLLGQHQ
jgi:predicted ATPase